MELLDKDDLGSFADNARSGLELRFIADSDEYTVKVVVTFIHKMLVNVLHTEICLVSFFVCFLFCFLSHLCPHAVPCRCFDTLVIPPFMVCGPFSTSRQHNFFVLLPSRSQCCSYFPLHSLCPFLTSRQHSVFFKLCFPPGIDAIVIPPLHSPCPFLPVINTESSLCCPPGIDVIVISHFNLSSKQCLCQVVFLSRSQCCSYPPHHFP